MEQITSTNEYKRYKTQYSKYWEVIAGDLQKFGGDTFANLFRLGDGIKYDEILNDVLKHLNISFDKSSSIINREDILIERVFEDIIKDIDENDVAKLIKDLNISVINYKTPAIMLAIQTAIKAGGFASYKITVIVANYIAKLILKRGLTLTANAMLTKGL